MLHAMFSLISWKFKNGNCEIVLGAFMCCIWCMLEMYVYVSVLVESNAFGFVLELLLWYECCDGCEGFTHPWEGREALG